MNGKVNRKCVTEIWKRLKKNQSVNDIPGIPERWDTEIKNVICG